MKFVSPGWLWALLILPLLYVIVIFDEKRKRRRFAEFIHEDLWPQIVPQINLAHRIRKARWVLLGFGFLLVALAQPQFGSHEETVEVSGLDVMLVLDISLSMNVEDVVPSRLKAAKHLTRTLVQQLEGDRVGVVAFAGSSYVACPLTADLSYLLDTVQILNPRTVQRQGTNIGAAIETALKALERGGEEASPDKNENSPPSHVIILISDGEDHEGETQASAAKVKESGVKLYILGVGTEKGGPIPVLDEKGNLQTYKKDRKGQPIVSSFHSSFLADLAESAGGKYWNITPGEQELGALLTSLKGLDRADYSERRYLVYEDRFQIPLLLALICFFLEMSISARRVLSLLIFLLAGLPFVQTASANSTAPLGSYLENKKGIEAFKEGNIEEAQKSFGAAQARDPTRPELQFNQGIVQFQQGEVDRAIEAFQNSARSSLELKNDDLYGKSLYNLGNAFTKKGNVKEAIQSYLGAIRSAQEQKNQRLEDEARKNLQLLLKEIKKQNEEQKRDQQQQQKQDQQQQQQQQQQDQQKQQQSQKEDQQKQDKDKDKDKDKGQQKGDQQKQELSDDAKSGEEKKDNNNNNNNQNQDAENPPPKEGSKAHKQQFKSKKMAPEDADRVMSELTNRERALQEKLQNQNGTAQNNLKDW